jgi:stage V sporulation protein AC
MEFKREGFVFGIGAKMFVIAGPVLVYGVVTAVLIGIVHWLANRGV